MPTFIVRIINSEFASCDDGLEYERPELALEAGIQGAARMVTDEVCSGKPSAAVVVTVEDVDGKALLRSVVALSVSTLSAEEGDSEAP